ncbi:hypothetical protein C0993_003642, partial [Termitomyces sp. T159_Od127]
MVDINTVDVFSVSLGVIIMSWFFYHTQRGPFPPGPKGYPVIGNVFDIPSKREWETFTKWGKKYGEICSVRIFGQTLVILNSAKIANEMLDKKGPIYSDRPILQMAGNLVGWKNTLILLPYGDRFRRFRRWFHGIMGSRASVQQFSHIEELQTHKFLQRVLKNPVGLADHVRHTAGAIILHISHGYEVQEKNDPFVELADKATDQISRVVMPGAWLVDVLPILRFVPSWFPGAGFKRTAKEWASTLVDMVEYPHDFVKRSMATGVAPVSFTSSLLEGKEILPEEDFEIK